MWTWLASLHFVWQTFFTSLYHCAYYWRLSQTLKITMSCGMFVAVPLVMYPVVEIVLPSLQHRFSETKDVVVELSLRYLLVAIACRFLKEIYFICLLYASMPNSVKISMCYNCCKIFMFFSCISSCSSESRPFQWTCWGNLYIYFINNRTCRHSHTVVFWDQFQGVTGKIKMARNAFLFLLGVAGMVTGTVLSIQDIIDYYTNVEGEGEYVYECD